MPEITITSKRDGFRRCGVAHRDVPVTWPDGSFTDEQIAILRAEPMLVVHQGAVVSESGELKEALSSIKALQGSLDDMTADRDRLQSALADMTVDRDRLQAELVAAGNATPQDKSEDTSGDDAAASDTSSKAKK